MQDKKDILFKDFPPLHITEETKKDVLKNPQLYANSSVRVHMGKFYTDEEYQRRREEVLNRPLPGSEGKAPRLVRKK